MTSALAFIALIGTSVNLHRGGSLEGTQPNYWAVNDTFIQLSTPDSNFGRDILLSGGPGKTILLKFGDLRRAIGPNRRIADAQLVLNKEIGQSVELAGAFKVRSSWGEGPNRRGVSMLVVPVETGAAAPTFASTWRERHAGPKPKGWQSPGGRGPADREAIPGTECISDKNVVVLQGLGPTFQSWLDRPDTNEGLALEFKSDVDFSSSEGPEELRPQVKLTLEDAAPVAGGDLAVTWVNSEIDGSSPWPAQGTKVEWTANITAEGDCGPFNVDWTVDGKVVATQRFNGLKSGESAEAKSTDVFSPSSSDPRMQWMEVRVSAAKPDSRPWNDARRVFSRSFPVNVIVDTGIAKEFTKWSRTQGANGYADLLAGMVDWINEGALAHSKYSFAPDGCKARLRLGHVSEADPRAIRVKATTWIIGKEDLSKLMADPQRYAAQEVMSRMGGFVDPLTPFSPYRGLTGYGDNRNDCEMPGVLGLNPEPWYDPAWSGYEPERTDLFESTAIAALHSRIADPSVGFDQWKPKRLALKLVGPMGRTIQNAKVTLVRPSTDPSVAPSAFWTGDSGAGILSLPMPVSELFTPPFDVPYGRLFVEITRGGATVQAELPGWLLLDSFARGNIDIAIIPLRFMLPDKPILEGADFASDKFVNAGGGLSVAEAARLVDTDPASGCKTPDKSWIEIDLGRDRLVGAITLKGKRVPERFKIKLHDTGQSADAARLWYAESGASRTMLQLGTNDALRVTAFPTRARYVRIEFGEGELSQITVNPYQE